MQTLRDKAGLILAAAGACILIADALYGGDGNVWIIIFPFVFRGTWLGVLGGLLLFLGIFIWALRGVHIAPIHRADECTCEGLVLVGPIPIFVKGKWAILLPLIIMAVMLAALLLMLAILLAV